MSKVSIYLNFMGNAEEAFNFYKKVFNSEFSTPIIRLGDVPMPPGAPTVADSEKNKIMHVAMPILGGTQIMATDMLESMGHELKIGNNTTINLECDSKEQADSLYKQLAEGATQCVVPHDEPWGYWGVCLDRFGIRWMFNVMAAQN